MIPIQVLLTETAIADEFVASFQARRLAEKFFYWFPLSVRAWLALCSDGAYRNFVRSRSLIAQSGRDLARYTPAGPIEVVSLGSGQGDKDLVLLEALRGEGRRVSYLPVDASQALLELAGQGALAAGFPAVGLKADVTRAEHLAALAADPEAPPRLVLMVGNTLGGFDPLAAAAGLRGMLRAQDLLLVDGELRFEVREDARLAGLHPLAKYFEARRDVMARLGGEILALRAGERVEVNHSYKYAAATFFQILAGAGLVPRWQGTSEDGRFLMVLAG